MSGEIEALVVEVSAFGKASDWSRFQIIGPDGAPLVDEPPTWTGPTPWRYVLDAPAPGRYRIQISPGGAYAGDDEARIAIPDGAPLRVCWRLQDQPPAGMSGWTRSEQDADLTVMAATREDVPSGPVLLVGSGVPSLGPNQVVGFQEGNPLLHTINLDVVEAASIARGDLPPGFEPVLSGMDGVWVAERSRPPGVYVPGLPAAGGDAEANLRTTLFFNGLRRLLAARAPLDLYGLTSPADVAGIGKLDICRRAIAGGLRWDTLGLKPSGLMLYGTRIP